MKDEQPSCSIDAPKLSVVVASVRSGSDLDMCLDALTGQAQGKDVEIVVADPCQDDSRRGVMRKYPGAIFLRLPGEKTLPALWGAGIERSTGEVVAITESTCVVDDRWVSEVLKAHRSPHPAIGGTVEVTGCKSLVDWAAYFCEYGQFMHPLSEGPVDELPGNNLSFKRWTLKSGREFVENGFWKTYWCRRLQEEGLRLVAVPSIVVYCKKSYRLVQFLIRRFHHGRCFAGMRVAQASLPKRTYYAVGSPLLPFLFLMRTVGAVVPKRRYLKEFLLSLPISVMAIAMWSMGEFCGYVAGAGKSCSYIY